MTERAEKISDAIQILVLLGCVALAVSWFVATIGHWSNIFGV